MKKKTNILKKVKLFYSYKRIVKSLRTQLSQLFNIRIDNAYRMYTVINIPEEIIGEAFSLKKSDIDRISENYIKEYLSELGKYLNSNGLSEIFEMYETRKVDKYSYLVVIGFSLFRSDEFYNKLYWRYIPILGGLSLISILIFFLL